VPYDYLLGGSEVKGVILAGGFGTRLSPLTKVLNKHLLPVYDRPMVYFPLQCQAKSGIKEVLLLTGGNNSDLFPKLLGDGSEFGLSRLEYAEQQRAGGIAYALGLAEEFAAGEPILLMLGDNIVQFTIEDALRDFGQQERGARVLLATVDNPQQFGIAELHGNQIVRIIEKPADPPSHYAVVGIYLYDSQVFDIVKQLKPSQRGELEITDVNNAYLERGELTHSMLSGWWLDAGEDFDQYLAACNQVAKGGANH